MAGYKSKQVELDELRANAAIESKMLAVELGKVQSETNLLILELKKNEGEAGFMQLEKDLILQAMEDSKKIDPALAARGVEQAEIKRQKMESEIA